LRTENDDSAGLAAQAYLDDWAESTRRINMDIYVGASHEIVYLGQPVNLKIIDYTWTGSSGRVSATDRAGQEYEAYIHTLGHWPVDSAWLRVNRRPWRVPVEVVEFAPCPKCHFERPLIWRDGSSAYRVTCRRCGTTGAGSQTPAEAVELWNQPGGSQCC